MVMDKQISIGEVIKVIVFVVGLSGMWYANKHQVDLLTTKVANASHSTSSASIKSGFPEFITF